MDYIDFPYVGTMRNPDGSTFQVKWVEVPESNAVFSGPTIYRSGRWNWSMPFDVGEIGEIPERLPPRSRLKLPARVCSTCFLGDAAWYEDGYPSYATPVTIAADGFATGCTTGPPTGAPFNCGFDFGFQSPVQC
jgi:hypothetical protein